MYGLFSNVYKYFKKEEPTIVTPPISYKIPHTKEYIHTTYENVYTRPTHVRFQLEKVRPSYTVRIHHKPSSLEEAF
jgi:hypothetical protein